MKMVEEIKRQAKSRLAPKRGEAAGIALLSTAFSGCILISITGIGVSLSLFHPLFGVLAALLDIAAWYFLIAVLHIGYVGYALSIWRGEPGGTAVLLGGFHRYRPFVGLYARISLLVLLWSCLFVVPGVLASYRYRLAVYRMLDDEGLTAREALEDSAELMRGRRKALFLLDLSFLGWGLLCVLTLGLLCLWVRPYRKVCYAGFYEAARKEERERRHG